MAPKHKSFHSLEMKQSTRTQPAALKTQHSIDVFIVHRRICVENLFGFLQACVTHFAVIKYRMIARVRK